MAGIATCALGHANPKLTQAIINQMNQMHHVSNLYLIPQQAVLAKWICDNSCADKVFFCNSGAEANEGAIKLARKHASMRGITVCLTFAITFPEKIYLVIFKMLHPFRCFLDLLKKKYKKKQKHTWTF